jgi:CMP-N,N'-diacetyllegionaminic acid synthase
LKTFALIHARGGSKRIPLKNIQEVGGKPLIAYPILLAKAVPEITRVIVSTDHPQIREVALQFGAEVPFVRPPDLSEDVPSERVTDHALRYLINTEDWQPEICITLTPTTPFTKPTDVERGLDLMREHPDWDSVVTVRRALEFPQWIIDYEEGRKCRTLLGNPLDGEYNVSQNLRRYHYPLGAFFINRVSSFLKNPSMYGRTWGAIELSANDHIDIDEPADLDYARRIVKR